MNTFCTIAPTKKLCAKEHMSWSLNNTSVSCERVRSVGRGSSTRFIAVRAVLVWRLSRRQNNYQLVSPARLAVTQRGVSHALTTLPRCLYFLFFILRRRRRPFRSRIVHLACNYRLQQVCWVSSVRDVAVGVNLTWIFGQTIDSLGRSCTAVFFK